MDGTGAARAQPGAAGRRCQHRLQHRCRGAGPARPVAGRHRALLSDASLAGWDGLGIVVQAYGKRAAPVIDSLYDMAERSDRKIMVRLVKGAYWDTEVKLAQELGVASSRCLRARSTPTSATWPARRCCWTARSYLSAVCHPQRAHLRRGAGDGRRGQGQLRVPAPARHGRVAARYRAQDRTVRIAASTPRSARIATCSPTWCAACWKMVPTALSSTRSSTRTFLG